MQYAVPVAIILILFLLFVPTREIKDWETTGVLAECTADSDCPTGDYNCTGTMNFQYYEEEGKCTDGKCTIGDYVFTNCSISVTVCSAECDENIDCESGICKSDCECLPE